VPKPTAPPRAPIHNIDSTELNSNLDG